MLADSTTPDLVVTRDEWRRRLDHARAAGRRVGVVLTMGSLHAGHLSLIRRAAADCDVVGVTDYVNPLQFGVGEDLAAYPRDVTGDRAHAGRAGAFLFFAPAAGEMWPEPPVTTIGVTGLSERWEGAARPGHFEGVATIVTKLLSLCGGCTAYFGEKDWQQLAVVRRVVADLSLPVDVVGCPTVRDPDGLALSSRNSYLSAVERDVAPTLYWSLLAAKRAVEDDGITDPALVTAAMERVVATQESLRLDYAAVVNPVDLTTPQRLEGDLRLLVAARLGKTRLIDNLAVAVPRPAGSAAAGGGTASGAAAAIGAAGSAATGMGTGGSAVAGGGAASPSIGWNS